MGFFFFSTLPLWAPEILPDNGVSIFEVVIYIPGRIILSEGVSPSS